jgi:predicted DNA-binding transcriptional regulator AlpA
MGAPGNDLATTPAVPVMLGGVAFDDDLLDLLADRLADRLASRLELAIKPREALVDADEVARMVGRKRSWVYDHVGDLGGVRLGSGPRPRLGFYPARVNAYLQRVTNPPLPPPLPRPAPRRRRLKSEYTPAGAKLLTVRGPHPDPEGRAPGAAYSGSGPTQR